MRFAAPVLRKTPPADEQNLALLDLEAPRPGAAFNTSLADYQRAMGIEPVDPSSAPDKSAAERDAALKVKGVTPTT